MLNILLACLFLVDRTLSLCSNPISVRTSQYQCDYAVTYHTPGDCTSPLFSSCNIVPHNTSTPAFSYSSLTQCNFYCCQDQNNYNIFCEKKEQQSYLVIIIVALACFFFLFLAAACCYRFNEDCCSCLGCNCFRGPARSSTPTHHDAIEYYLSYVDDTQSHLEPIARGQKFWQQNQLFSDKNECSVCLCEQANFVLQCGHTFHKDCIFECFRRKYECILCRRTELNIFKLYCRKCLKRYIQIFYYELKFIEKEGKNDNLCELCTRTQELQEISVINE